MSFMLIVNCIFALFMLVWLYTWLFKRDLRTDLIEGPRKLAWKIRCAIYNRKRK